MTNIQASEMGWAVGQYENSDLKAYMDGYADGRAHEFDLSRGADDDAYFAGYQKAVKDEQIQRDLGWLNDLDEADNVPGYAERHGWAS